MTNLLIVCESVLVLLLAYALRMNTLEPVLIFAIAGLLIVGAVTLVVRFIMGVRSHDT